MARRKTSQSKSNKSMKAQKPQEIVQIQEEATHEIVINSFGQPKCDGYVCLIDCENHIPSSTTDIKDSFSTVVVPFDYEIYIHLEASLPQALKDVEEMMLIYASNRLNLTACDFQSQKALIPDDNGIIPSIASYPGDEVDQDNVNCITEIEDKPKDTACIPIQGYLTATYGGISQAKALNLVHEILDDGMKEDLLVTSTIPKLSFIGTRKIDFTVASVEEPTTKQPESVALSSSSSSVSIMTMTGVILAIFILGVMSAFYVWRRKKENKESLDDDDVYDNDFIHEDSFVNDLNFGSKGTSVQDVERNDQYTNDTTTQSCDEESRNDDNSINFHVEFPSNIESESSYSDTSVTSGNNWATTASEIISQRTAHHKIRKSTLRGPKKNSTTEKNPQNTNNESLSTILEASRETSLASRSFSSQGSHTFSSLASQRSFEASRHATSSQGSHNYVHSPNNSIVSAKTDNIDYSRDSSSDIDNTSYTTNNNHLYGIAEDHVAMT